MFGIEKNRLEINLEKIRVAKCCAYMGGDRCDCKYGNEGDEPQSFMSESFNGCPEIRQVLDILKVMTEDEFSQLCYKAKMTI